jgi:hypothetical protein
VSEEEAFFLFVAYRVDYGEPRVDRNRGMEIRPYHAEVLRASMQKLEREGEIYKRINVDFDPLGQQMAYLVTCRVSGERNGVIEEGIPKFAGIFLSEDEANLMLDQVKNGKFRDYLDAKQKFIDADMMPVLITQK